MYKLFPTITTIKTLNSAYKFSYNEKVKHLTFMVFTFTYCKIWHSESCIAISGRTLFHITPSPPLHQ